MQNNLNEKGYLFENNANLQIYDMQVIGDKCFTTKRKKLKKTRDQFIDDAFKEKYLINDKIFGIKNTEPFSEFFYKPTHR